MGMIGWFAQAAKTSPELDRVWQTAQAQGAAEKQARADMGWTGGGIHGLTSALAQPNGQQNFQNYMQQFARPSGGGMSAWSTNYYNGLPQTPPIAPGTERSGTLPGGINWKGVGEFSAPKGTLASFGQMGTSSSYGGGGQTQMMIAPDGSQKAVPSHQVQHYLARGARIGGM